MIGGCVALSLASPDAHGAAAGIGTGLWLGSWAIAIAAWLTVQSEYGALRSLARATSAGDGQPYRGTTSGATNQPPSQQHAPGVTNSSRGEAADFAVAVEEPDRSGSNAVPSINPAAPAHAERLIAGPPSMAASGERLSARAIPLATPGVPSTTSACASRAWLKPFGESRRPIRNDWTSEFLRDPLRPLELMTGPDKRETPPTMRPGDCVVLHAVGHGHVFAAGQILSEPKWTPDADTGWDPERWPWIYQCQINVWVPLVNLGPHTWDFAEEAQGNNPIRSAVRRTPP